MNKKQKKMLTRIIIALIMLIALYFIPVTGIVRLVCYLVVYGIIGYDILKKALLFMKRAAIIMRQLP